MARSKKYFKTLTVGDRGYVQFGLCLDWPSGAEMQSGKVRFMGTCWHWTDSRNHLIEGRMFWFGPFSLVVARTLYRREVRRKIGPPASGYRNENRHLWAMSMREPNFTPHWYMWDDLADLFTHE